MTASKNSLSTLKGAADAGSHKLKNRIISYLITEYLQQGKAICLMESEAGLFEWALGDQSPTARLVQRWFQSGAGDLIETNYEGDA